MEYLLYLSRTFVRFGAASPHCIDDVKFTADAMDIKHVKYLHDTRTRTTCHMPTFEQSSYPEVHEHKCADKTSCKTYPEKVLQILQV